MSSAARLSISSAEAEPERRPATVADLDRVEALIQTLVAKVDALAERMRQLHAERGGVTLHNATIQNLTIGGPSTKGVSSTDTL